MESWSINSLRIINVCMLRPYLFTGLMLSIADASWGQVIPSFMQMLTGYLSNCPVTIEHDACLELFPMQMA